MIKNSNLIVLLIVTVFISCQSNKAINIDMLCFQKGDINQYYNAYRYNNDTLLIFTQRNTKGYLNANFTPFYVDTFIYKGNMVFNKFNDTLLPFPQNIEIGDTIVEIKYRHDVPSHVQYYKTSSIILEKKLIEGLIVIKTSQKFYETATKDKFDKKVLYDEKKWRLRDHFSQNTIAYSILEAGLLLNLILIDNKNNDTTLFIAHNAPKQFKTKTNKIIKKLAYPDGIPERALYLIKRDWE